MLRRALPLTLTFTLTSWLPALASASPALSLRLGGGDKLGGAHTQDSGALSTPNPLPPPQVWGPSPHTHFLPSAPELMLSPSARLSTAMARKTLRRMSVGWKG